MNLHILKNITSFNYHYFRVQNSVEAYYFNLKLLVTI